MSLNLDLKLGIKPKAGRERKREREGGGNERIGPNLEQPSGIFFFKEGWREIWARLA
jgi:hypothetical protein